MSSLFNQTNLAPGTSFASGSAGNSNFPNGISIGTAGIQYLVSASLQGNPPRTTFYNAPAPINSLSYINSAGLQVYNSLVENNSAVLNDTSLTFISSATSGSPALVQNAIVFNPANMSNTGSNLAIALRGVSSIQTATRVINADRLLSTVQGYGWA